MGVGWIEGLTCVGAVVGSELEGYREGEENVGGIVGDCVGCPDVGMSVGGILGRIVHSYNFVNECALKGDY